MTTIYVATYGQYDDYGIEGAFLSYEKACEAAVHSACPGPYFVEHYDGETGMYIKTTNLGRERGVQPRHYYERKR